MYDFAHVWAPEKSLVRERYAAVSGQMPRVLFGLSQSWEPLLHVMRHPSKVKSVAFSPDGGRLASGSDQIVRIWNTATGEPEDELEGHTAMVWSVAFSHDGRFIVSGSEDNTVRIWNTTTWKTTYTLTGHTSWVRSVAISRNNEFVVSGSIDRTVRIWDTATGELLRKLEGHANEVRSVAVSPDCQHIASGEFSGVWVWTKNGVIEHKLEYLSRADLAFSHDDHRIVSNLDTAGRTITGHRLSPWNIDSHPDQLRGIRLVAYSPYAGEIVCGMGNWEVHIWNTETNERRIAGRHSQVITSVSFSPDGSRIASGSDDGTIRIWDPRLKKTINQNVFQVVASYDSWCVMVTVSPGHIQVWRVAETMTKTNELSIGVRLFALSRDGSRVVTAGVKESIWVWNHLTDTRQRRISDFEGVSCAAFSYNGGHIVFASRDKTVRIWDFHTRNEIGLYQHSDVAICVAFSRDGGRVAFGSFDSRVWIWDPSTGYTQIEPDNNVNNLERVRFVHSVAFSHDGNHVISGWGFGGGVRIWNVTTNESTMLSERIQLPDGTRVHSLGNGDFHVYDPVDQEMTNGMPPYLLSISPDRDWITGEQAEHSCWIPPQYRDFSKAHIAGSIVCLETHRNGMIVLDLKRTPR